MQPFLRDHTGIYVDGRWVAPTAGRTEVVINPSTEEAIATVAVADEGDVDHAIAAARRAFDEGPWPRMSPEERCDLLQRLHDRIAERRDELIALVIAEIGAAQPLAGRLHVDTPLEILRFCIDAARKRERVLPLPPTVTRDRRGAKVLGTSVKVREPAGVVSAITPFNFPFFLNLAKIAPALAVGCTMVLKPSPLTPLQALVFGDLADEVGLPPGVLNVVTGDVEVGEQLTSDERVDLVTFTGSDLVGAAVMANAAPTLKGVLLELGGKSPMIVRADADLDLAARAGIGQITTQAGQGCALLTRHIVHRAVYDDYLDRASKIAGAIKVGDPADPEVTMGPLIRASQRDRVEGYVAEGREAGARVAAGGQRPTDLERGFFYEPTLLYDVESSMSIAQDEIFGPVGVVIPFDSDDEAIAIANDSRYGLAAGLWSADAGTAYEMALGIRAGRISINGGSGSFNPAAPFGGYKRSGIGREFGEEGLDAYTEIKAISFHAG